MANGQVKKSKGNSVGGNSAGRNSAGSIKTTGSAVVQPTAPLPIDHSMVPVDDGRRDFMVLAASATMGIGAASAAWPFIKSMTPAGDVLAMASTEVSIASVKPGQIITVMWRGKPVFVRRRTPDEIKQAESAKLTELPDPQKDAERVKAGKAEWLVLVGVCTHLGCVPLGHSGDYNGWFWPVPWFYLRYFGPHPQGSRTA